LIRPSPRFGWRHVQRKRAGSPNFIGIEESLLASPGTKSGLAIGLSENHLHLSRNEPSLEEIPAISAAIF